MLIIMLINLILLIEPYGIEMGVLGLVGTEVERLLIEPYGIEIFERWHDSKRFFKLLIEPYGIEIRWPKRCR